MPDRRSATIRAVIVAPDNGIQFGGLLSEQLITDVLRGVGVKTSRCNYTRMYLNEKPAGVYVNVERIDQSSLDRQFTVPSDSGVDDALASMEQLVRDRYPLARTQFDSPGERPSPTPASPEPSHEGPRPGPPSADAPTDLRAVNLSGAGVELRWVDHAEGESAFVVQRCTGAECTDFANAIGQGGRNLTTAVDRQVQPGTTYRYRVYAVLPTPQGPRGTGASNVETVTIRGTGAAPP